MAKRATSSTCKDPKHRSDKPCVCGGHQGKRGKKKPKPRAGAR